MSAMEPTAPPAAFLVRGDDPSLVAQAAQDVIDRALHGADPSSALEEIGGVADEVDIGAVVDALRTPPFIVERRVVVVRDAGRVPSAEAGRLTDCLADPLPGVTLVLVGGGGTVPAALVRAVQAHGEVVDAGAGRGRARAHWLEQQVQASSVRLDARARATLADHLGEDVGRLRALLDTLESAYGEGAAVDEERLEPFLGGAGAVASWDLTDAIDAGEPAVALEVLERLLGPGDAHPLVVLAVLHRHFGAMLRLDGSGIQSADEAAAVLGMRSSFPAKKAMEQAVRLGSARIGRAIELLAGADLDVRGRTGLPDSTVLEVLVARLARLSPDRARAASGRRRTSGR